MNKMKKIAVGAAFALPCVMLADGAPTMDSTEAVSMLTAAKDGLVSLLASAAPIITAIVLAGLAIWAAIALVRVVKKAFNTGK